MLFLIKTQYTASKVRECIKSLFHSLQQLEEGMDNLEEFFETNKIWVLKRTCP